MCVCLEDVGVCNMSRVGGGGVRNKASSRTSQDVCADCGTPGKH